MANDPFKCRGCGESKEHEECSDSDVSLCANCNPPAILCPHCKEPLIIRCYYERWVDFGQTVEDGYLMYNEDDHHNDSVLQNFGDQTEEYNDYECAKCKGNVSEYVGMKLEDLPAIMKGGENNG